MSIKIIEIDTSISSKFAESIENKQLQYIKIANDLKISRSHLGKVLGGIRPLSELLRLKLNAYLNTDY